MTDNDDDLIGRHLAVSAVRQALIDAAHAHGSTMMKASSAMFKAETYATNAIATLPAQAVEDRAIKKLIAERDYAQDMADKLAFAIGGHAIGDHSNMNCPWENALEIAEERSALTPSPADTTARLVREALQLADAALCGVNWNMNEVRAKVKAALAATKGGKA